MAASDANEYVTAKICRKQKALVSTIGIEPSTYSFLINKLQINGFNDFP
jgi:hypothetical protein